MLGVLLDSYPFAKLCPMVLMMSVLDACIIAVMLFFVVWGAWVGFIRQLALVLALLVGFAVAGAYAGELQRLAAPVLSSPRLTFILSYLILLAAAYGGVRLLALGLRRVVNLSLTPWFDRVSGGALGGAKAYLLLTLFYLAFSGLSTALTPLLQNSYFSPQLAAGAHALQTMVRDEQVRQLFIPKIPAISAATPIPGSPP